MDCYKILEIEPSATSEEIKKAYQEKALIYHPDKSGSEEKFHLIDRAYKILRDPEKRRLHDSERIQNLDHLIIHETVSRRELNYDESSKEYTHRCKCGNNYLLDCEEYNSDDEIILSCDECSLNILITI